MLLERVLPLAVGAAFAMVLATGCGGAPPPPEPPLPKPVAKPAEPRAPAGQVDRRRLDTALLDGPAVFFEQVPIEEVLEEGKFVGWRLPELPVAWSEVDLRPGDVVTAVNGLPLETPDQLWAAWTSLMGAKAIEIAYQRDGAAAELTVPIWGESDPGVAQRLEAKKGAARAGGAAGAAGRAPAASSAAADEPSSTRPASTAAGPKRKPTIVIGPTEEPKGEW